MKMTKDDTLKEDFKSLLVMKRDIESQVDTMRRKLMDNYVKGCPTFIMPTTTSLIWRDDNVMSVDYQGNVFVSTWRPGILDGRGRKESKAGSKYKILKSWKASKKTKGTHYVLYDTRTQRVANYYG